MKVQLFCEDHKNLRQPPYGFDIYLVNVETIRSLVAFSEKLDFNFQSVWKYICFKDSKMYLYEQKVFETFEDINAYLAKFPNVNNFFNLDENVWKIL